MRVEPSPLADAFFIALAGGVSEAKGCGGYLAGAARVDMQEVVCDDHDEAASLGGTARAEMALRAKAALAHPSPTKQGPATL